MKRCPNGHIIHNDSLKFCTECGKLLEPYTPAGKPAGGAPAGTAGHSHVDAPKPPRKAASVIKRVLIGLAVLVVVAVVWISNKINSTTYLVFNTEAVVFSKGGGAETVNIDYDGVVWEVTYHPSWIDVIEDDTDNTLMLVASGNAEGSNREDHITVKSGKVVQQLAVGQLGAATYVRVDPSEIEFERSGGRKYVSIETDGITQDINYPDFSNVEVSDDGGFYVELNRNSGYALNGVITVVEDGRKATIRLHQKGDCPDCGGRGQRTCPSCGGMGQFGYGFYAVQCQVCHGAGNVSCYSCHGTGER